MANESRSARVAAQGGLNSARTLAAAAVLFVAPSVTGAPHPPQRLDTIPGPSDPSLHLVSNQTDFGSAVASGDLNGDGFSDVVVGAQLSLFADHGGLTGAAYVYMGGPAGLDATPDFVIHGQTDWAGLGFAVLVADVGGDGRQDVIVSAPADGTSEGAVYVWFGGDTFRRRACCASSDCGSPGKCENGVCRLREVGPPSVSVHVNPASNLATMARFGASVAALNFAGHSGSVRDLAIGAPDTEGYQGAVYLLQGPLPEGVVTLPDDLYSGPKVPGWLSRFSSLNGAVPGRLGFGLGNAGNLDSADQTTGHSLFVFGTNGDFYVFSPQLPPETRDSEADVTVNAATGARAHVIGPSGLAFSKGPLFAGYTFAGSGWDRPAPGVYSAGTSSLIIFASDLLGEVHVMGNEPSINSIASSVTNPLASGVLDASDVDGDGVADMAFLTSGAVSRIQIFSHISAPRSSPGDYSYALPPDTAGGLLITLAGDVDHDGQSDVVVGDPNFSTTPGAHWGDGRIHLLHDRFCPDCVQKDVHDVCRIGKGQCLHLGVSNVCAADGHMTCGNPSPATPYDVTAPVLTSVASVKLEQANHDGTPYAFGPVAARDNCDATVAVASNAPATFPLGMTTVTFTARDQTGNAATTSALVEVVDTTPPAIAAAVASPNVLTRDLRKGAKNNKNKMVAVTVVPSVSDICDAAPKCKITSVSVNDGCFGKPPKHAQFEMVGDLTVKLRARRCSKGAERVYTMAVRCTDASGQSASTSTTVTVPKRDLPKGEHKRQVCAAAKQACTNDKRLVCENEKKKCGTDQQRCEAAAKTKSDRQKCAAAKQQCDEARERTCRAAERSCEDDQKICTASKKKHGHVAKGE